MAPLLAGVKVDFCNKQHTTTHLHKLDDDLAIRTEHLRALGDERLLVDLLVAQRENVQGHA